jgi:hypothetical protein
VRRRARVAVHVHSTWSYDGRLSLPEVASIFRRLGYDAVLMAEHDVDFDENRWEEYRAACVRASTDRLRLVAGIEYADRGNRVHVPVWGAREFLGRGLPTLDLLRRARDAGGAAVLAHPSRRDAHELVDDEWLDLLDGIEAWNRKYDGVAPSAIGIALLSRARHLVPVFGLDFHSRRQLFPFAMRIENGAALEGPVLAGAVRNGSHSLAGIPARTLLDRPATGFLDRAERTRRTLRRRRPGSAAA